MYKSWNLYLWIYFHFSSVKFQAAINIWGKGQRCSVLRAFPVTTDESCSSEAHKGTSFSPEDWALREIGRIFFSSFWVMLRLIRKRADLFWCGQATLVLKVKTVAGELAYWPWAEQIHQGFFFFFITNWFTGEVARGCQQTGNISMLSIYVAQSVACKHFSRYLLVINGKWTTEASVLSHPYAVGRGYCARCRDQGPNRRPSNWWMTASPPGCSSGMG